MRGAGLILDFDGTIMDTEEPLFVSWAELWADQGHELSRRVWQGIIGLDGRFDPWAELQQRVGRPLAPELRERRQARRDELLAAQGVRAGVHAWLDEAASLGVPVGVASSSPPSWVEGHLHRLGLRDRFAALVCCDGVVPSKPDPTSYRLACERIGADPRRSVAVEDSPPGVRAAVVAGLFTVAVPHGLTVDLDLAAADLVLDTLELLSLSEGLSRAGARSRSRSVDAGPVPRRHDDGTAGDGSGTVTA